jgi:hypothetical protein
MSTNETKRQPVITTEVNENGHLVIAFPTLGKQLTLDPAECSPVILADATLHGFKQKLVDAAAKSRNPETGRSATDQDKFDAVKAIFDRITSPEGAWNAPREGGGNEGGLLARALVTYYGGKHSIEQIREKLAAYDKKSQEALRRNPKIAKIIEELRASKVDTSIDTDEMLSELGE